MAKKRKTPTTYTRDGTLVMKHSEVRMAAGNGSDDFQKKVRRAVWRNPALRHYMPGLPKEIPGIRSLDDPRYYDVAWTEEAVDLFFRPVSSDGVRSRLKAVFAAAKANPALVLPWPERGAHQEAAASQPASQDKPEEMPEGEAIRPDAEDIRAKAKREADEDESVTQPQPPVVFNKDQETLTTSLLVARAYGKRHDHVLRDIERILETSPDLGASFVFRKTNYVGGNGEARPMYEMNQNAFVLLVSGFTGEKALQLRIAYIAEFERMKAALKETAQQAPGQEMVTMFTALTKMMESHDRNQERMTTFMDRVLAKLEAPAAKPHAEQAPPVPRQGFPGGTESFSDFCGHHQDINVQWIHRFLSEEGIRGDGMGAGRIKRDPTTGRWVCTDRAAQDKPRLFVDIKGAVLINGVDKPYAHITKPAGVNWLSKQLDQMRKLGPISRQTSSQGNFDLRDKDSDDADEG